MEPYVPIFIIVHNQFEILKKTIASYEKYIKTPFQIVYHNVATTYEPTLQFLKEQELLGRVVYNTTINDHHTVTQTIDDYYQKHPECEYYVMTDPDIELDNVNGDILELYIHTLKETKAVSVGPMLRIDDIPDYYPRKDMAIDYHTQQFWSQCKFVIPFKKEKYRFIACSTDTTFQLCSFKNRPTCFPHHESIRVFSPYSARHLDWYIDPNNLTPCQKYYQQTASDISHWNKSKWNGEWNGTPIPDL
jgi:hypothetical protein